MDERTAGKGSMSPARGPADPALSVEDREARLRTQRLQREVAVLSDQVAALEQRLARMGPLLTLQSGLLAAEAAILAPFRLARTAARLAIEAPSAPRRIRAAAARSRRFSATGAMELSLGALGGHLKREFGLNRPTLYTVRQRISGGPTLRPRILHVIGNVWIGGSTQLVVDLHDYLGHRFEMQVATAALPRHGRHKGMAITHIPMPPQGFAIRDLFRRFRPQVVHIHYWGDVDEPWYRPFFEVARDEGVPILQNVNTPVEPFRRVPSDETVFVSQTIRDTWPDIPGVVIHPGIDLSAFAPRPWAPGAMDTIGMVYRLERDKLDETAIEPFIQVLKARPTTRAVIVGDGSLFGHFLQRVTSEGLRERVEFTGYTAYGALPEHLAKFRTFVAPVHSESFGQVVPFAMSMGAAVAGNHVGALPEILGGSETLGHGVAETTARILDLLGDPARIEAQGLRNRALAAEHFSVETMAAGYGALYTRLAPDADLMPGFPPAVRFPL